MQPPTLAQRLEELRVNQRAGVGYGHGYGSGRVRSELRRVADENADWYSCEADASLPCHWRGKMSGPPDTPYAGGVFTFSIIFPPEFPIAPPEFFFHIPEGASQPLPHPDIDQLGRVTGSLLAEGSDYSPAMMIAASARPILPPAWSTEDMCIGYRTGSHMHYVRALLCKKKGVDAAAAHAWVERHAYKGVALRGVGSRCPEWWCSTLRARARFCLWVGREIARGLEAAGHGDAANALRELWLERVVVDHVARGATRHLKCPLLLAATGSTAGSSSDASAAAPGAAEAGAAANTANNN